MESRAMTSGDRRCRFSVEDPGTLRLLNWLIGLVQLGAGAVMLALVDRDKTAPVYTNFAATSGERTIANQLPVQRHLTDFSVGDMSAAFLLMSAADHLLAATFLWHTYRPAVYAGRNPLRWFEYFFSASLMHVEIALLCGIYDAHLLFAIFALTATTMLFGHFQETYGSQTDAKLFWAGFVPHAGNWSVIACYFFRAVSQRSPPDWVWSILVIIFVLDLTFGAVALWHQRTGKHASAEAWYMVLSLTSKQLLAWLQFYGIQGMRTQ